MEYVTEQGKAQSKILTTRAWRLCSDSVTRIEAKNAGRDIFLTSMAVKSAVKTGRGK